MLVNMSVASPIWCMLFLQLVRRAAARALCTAGNKSAMRVPMIAMTTINSTSVKALLLERVRTITLAQSWVSKNESDAETLRSQTARRRHRRGKRHDEELG